MFGNSQIKDHVSFLKLLTFINKVMRLIYISQGNIPSLWAHTFQTMKMAEAFSSLVQDFRLVTQTHILNFLRPRFEYESWYGIRSSFRIIRLPTWKIPRRVITDVVRYPDFDKMAARYAYWKGGNLIFTRSPYAGQLSVSYGMNTIVESHLAIYNQHFKQILAIKDNPYFLGLVTITDELRQLYLQQGIPEKKIFVWSDAVDLKTFEQLPDKMSLRQQLDLPQKKFIATYCGHLYADRGIEDIFQAAERLPDILFLLIGGWQKDVTKWKAETQHLQNVVFTGFVLNQLVPKYLRASDVLLMPYSTQCRTASWMSPMKLFEYMASQRPLVASDLPVLRKHLRLGQNALLIQPDNPGSLVDAIKTLKQKPTYGVRLAQTAYAEVQPYTWDKRAKAILDYFSQI